MHTCTIKLNEVQNEMCPGVVHVAKGGMNLASF